MSNFSSFEQPEATLALLSNLRQHYTTNKSYFRFLETGKVAHILKIRLICGSTICRGLPDNRSFFYIAHKAINLNYARTIDIIGKNEEHSLNTLNAFFYDCNRSKSRLVKTHTERCFHAHLNFWKKKLIKKLPVRLTP